jgi:uncharacterized protein YidB (DUF937 family)
MKLEQVTILKGGVMGLLGEMVKGLAGKFLGGGAGTQNPLLDIALSLLTNPQTGGLGGLVEAFKSKGLNDIMSSWVSTGQNLPISGNQIRDVLGSGLIQQFAKKLGSSGEEVSGGLASLLPEIIDKLTPNGTLPESDALLQRLASLKKDLLNI